MKLIKELDGISIRDCIDATSLHEVQREVELKTRHSFSGSLKFEKRGNAEYLIYRPTGGKTQKSLGPRNEKTEQTLRDFTEGKADIEERLASINARIADFARVLKARGLGRLPSLTSRVIKKFDELGWLGKSIIVIGTNSIYGYEIKAGVRVEPDVIATEDLDIPFDSRKKITFAGEVSQRGFIGVLQTVDRSFQKFSKATFSAVNKDGFIIDLMEPQDHQKFIRFGQTRLSDNPDDLIPVSSDSSKWLLNSPKFEATVFDWQGYPLRMVTLDPRVFAL